MSARDRTDTEARPSIHERVTAIPLGRRRLLGALGVLVAVVLLALGLSSLDTGSEPVTTVPGTLRVGTTAAR